MVIIEEVQQEKVDKESLFLKTNPYLGGIYYKEIRATAKHGSAKFPKN